MPALCTITISCTAVCVIDWSGGWCGNAQCLEAFKSTCCANRSSFCTREVGFDQKCLHGSLPQPSLTCSSCSHAADAGEGGFDGSAVLLLAASSSTALHCALPCASVPSDIPLNLLQVPPPLLEHGRNALGSVAHRRCALHGGCTGANSSSSMAQLMASNQLCNSYMAFNTNYHDSGLWGVYAVADKGANLPDLAWVIMHEISKMAYNVADEDIVRAKNQLKASLLFSQDGPSGECCCQCSVLALGPARGGAWRATKCSAGEPGLPASTWPCPQVVSAVLADRIMLACDRIMLTTGQQSALPNVQQTHTALTWPASLATHACHSPQAQAGLRTFCTFWMHCSTHCAPRSSACTRPMLAR